MKKFITFLILLILMGGFVFADDSEFMDLSQISPGMKGYGLTVFKGVTIEKFNFTVLGIIKEVNRGHDVIYVELDHPRINRSNSAVIQGMSGSPCYIDGKLIGAVSMGWGFAKENVCMLTPIKDMLEAWDPVLPQIPAQGQITPQNQIPLSLSGLSPSTKEIFGDRLKNLGFNLVAGGGMGSEANMPDADKATIEPGSSVGCVYIDGDITAAGVGTVTYKKGDKIIAFGHPMEEVGPVDVPMCTAYVVDIFSSFDVSHKITNPLKEVGRIYQDRSFSIAGELGKEAKMSPVTVKIKDHSTNREQNLNCRVVSQPIFFNALSMLIPIEALSRLRVQKVPTYGDFTYNIELENGEKYSYSNTYTDETSIDLQVALELINIFSNLTSSKYGPQKVKSLSITGDIYDGNKTAIIERVFINKNQYKPGEKINVGIVLRKFGSPNTFTVHKDITVPKNITTGKIALLIQGGSISDVGAEKTEENNNANPNITGDSSTSFKQFFTKTLEKEKNNELIIKVIEEKGNLLVAKGEKLEDLPDYMKLIFSNTNNSLVTSESNVHKNVYKEDFVTMGVATIVLSPENKTAPSVYDNNMKPLVTVHNFGKNYKELVNFPKSEYIKLIDELDEALKVTAKDVKDQNIPSTLEPLKEEEKAEEAKAEKKEEETKKEEVKPNSKIKTSIKKPLQLLWEDKDDFKGTYTNCNLNNDMILPSVQFDKKIPAEAQLATCGIKSSFGTIIGLGLDCGIGFLENDKITNYEKLDNLWVSSMCEVNGNVYIATNPSSTVYKLDKDKKLTKIKFLSRHKYISDMIEFKGNILIGFSDSDEILLCDTNLKVLKKANHKGAFTTKFAKHNDKVFAGTNKRIITFKEDLNIKTYVNDPGGITTALSINSKGDLYAYIYGKNIIIKKDKNGITKINSKSEEIFDSYIDKFDTVYFVGKDTITKIYKNDNFVTDSYKKSLAQFSHIIPIDDESVYITSTNHGSVFKVDLYPKECSYTSQFLDFGEKISISSINVPKEYSVKILQGKTEKDIDPNLKLNHFRVKINFKGKVKEPLKKINIRYFTDNKAPKIKVTNLDNNYTIKAKPKIEWTVTDPNNDNYDVRIFIKGEKEDYKQVYPNDKEKPEPDKDPIKSYEFDTEAYPDGIYTLKFEADDSLSNPTDSKSSFVELTNIKIQNNGPELNVESGDIITLKENEKFTISGSVKSKDLLGVEYSIGSAYKSLEIKKDKFNIDLQLPKGTYTLKIRAVDKYDNHTDKEIKITVE